MLIFVDSVDLKAIKKWQEVGLIDGVTTNPSLAASAKISYSELLHEICAIVDDNVSAEVISENFDGIMREAENLVKISAKIVIKIPLTNDGLQACRHLVRNGVRTNVTLCFSSLQAMLAAKAGATFVSPFIGRVDDIGYDGIGLISEIKQIFDNYNFQTKILTASMRNLTHLREVATIGADVATLPPKLMQQMIAHPLTKNGLQKFLSDWQKSGNKI